MIKRLVVLSSVISLVWACEPKANTDEIDRKISSFFEDFHRQDTTALRAYFDATAQMQSAVELEDGSTSIVKGSLNKFIKSIGSIPDSIDFEERISTASIQLTKGMAQAFVPYQFYIDQELSHCGVNSFVFVKVEGQWLISNIIDTRSKTACQ